MRIEHPAPNHTALHVRGCDFLRMEFDGSVGKKDPRTGKDVPGKGCVGGAHPLLVSLHLLDGDGEAGVLAETHSLFGKFSDANFGPLDIGKNGQINVLQPFRLPYGIYERLEGLAVSVGEVDAKAVCPGPDQSPDPVHPLGGRSQSGEDASLFVVLQSG